MDLYFINKVFLFIISPKYVNIRNFITEHSKFFGDLLGCMMCTSTWVGFFFSLAFFSPTASLVTIPYSNIFFDGMLASGGVWAINAVIEWFEENKPKKDE